MISITDMLREPIDPILNGIRDFAEEKQLNFISGILGTNQAEIDYTPNERYLIQESDNPRTFLNDILIDRSYSISTEYSNRIVEHTTDTGFQFSEAKIKNKIPYSLKCKLTTEDHKEKLEKLKNYADGTEPLSLFYMNNTFENLLVTSISEEITNVLYSEFTINLREYKTVGIEKIPSPPAEVVVAAPKTTKKGKTNTTKTIYTGDKTVLTETEKKEVLNSNLPSYALEALKAGGAI